MHRTIVRLAFGAVLALLCSCSSPGAGSCSPACDTGQECVSGSCQCTATSCTGCCSGTACQSRSAQHCGTGGASCVDCTPRADTCAGDGTCKCGAMGACASGDVCDVGQCSAGSGGGAAGSGGGSTGAGGGSGGGSAGTGGSASAGGGSASSGGGTASNGGGTSGAGGGAASCNASLCSGGCCDLSSQCITPPNAAACGKMGSSCMSCQTPPSECFMAGSGTCSNGVCQFTPKAVNTACTDDGLACTLDVCDGQGACTHPAAPMSALCRAATSECDTDTFCDGTHTACPQHVVKPLGTACTADTNPCSLDQCDGAGNCAHPPVAMGTACTSDSNACTTDVCDSSGNCTHPNVANDTSCGATNICCNGGCVGDGTTANCGTCGHVCGGANARCCPGGGPCVSGTQVCP